METATLDQGTKVLALFRNVPREQVQALLASGLLADIRDANLAGVNRDAFRKFVGLNPLNQPLLKELGTIIVPATTKPLISHDKFVVGNVGIVYVGKQFRAQFLGKIEESTTEMMFRYATLTRASRDGPILAELGEKAETTLAQIHALIERQANGEEGVLLTNGWANIFYVRGVNGELWSVHVDRNGDGWYVTAHSVTDPSRWYGGNRVFSRSS